MKRLLLFLVLLGACATLPDMASAGHRRHGCYGPGYSTYYQPYYYAGYYSSAYRWGGYYPYGAYYGSTAPYGPGAPNYGATWGFGFGMW